MGKIKITIDLEAKNKEAFNADKMGVMTSHASDFLERRIKNMNKAEFEQIMKAGTMYIKLIECDHTKLNPKT